MDDSIIAAEQIARVALDHYHNVLPNKGKPKENEWTVYAAIVATATTTTATATTKSSSSSLPWVVSCATGTKCTAVVHSQQSQQQQQQNQKQGEYEHYDYSASILHDSHAEVLCRRGFVRVLVKEMQRKIMHQQQQEEEDHSATATHTANCEQDLLEIDDSSSNSNSSATTCFCLQHGIQLHLYISDSPCGDASIYSLAENNNDNDNDDNDNEKNDKKSTTTTTLTFTGAKVIVSQGETPLMIRPLVEHSHDNNDDCGGDGRDKQQADEGYRCQPLPTTNNSSSGGGTRTTDNSSLVVVAREPTTQLLAMLRTKSGRSNLEASRRSTSMSCSDKILRWAVLGLQGAVLSSSSSSSCIPHPIRLASCIVSRDPRTIKSYSTSTAAATSSTANSSNEKNNTQLQALQRSIPDRVASVHASLIQLCNELDACDGGGGGEEDSSRNDDDDDDDTPTRSCSSNVTREFAKHLSVSFPAVFVVDAIFPRGKAVMESEKLKSSSNTTSANGRMNNARKRKHNGEDQSPPPAHVTAKKSTSPSSISFSPTGLCINWNCAEDEQDDVELTVGARGTRHGKKPKTARDYSRLESRLCRNQIRLLLSNLTLSSSSSSSSPVIVSTTLSSRQQSQQQQHAQNTLHDDDDAQSTLSSSTSCYKTWKRSLVSPRNYQIRQHIFQQGPLKGWLVGGEPLVHPVELVHKCCQQQQEQLVEQQPPPPHEEK